MQAVRCIGLCFTQVTIRTQGETMKRVKSALLAFTFLILLFVPPVTRAADQAPILPESLAAREQMAASMKTQTIFFNAETPEKATEQLNQSNESFAKRGWNVFSIIPYVDNGDFRGFFVTYQKSLVIN